MISTDKPLDPLDWAKRPRSQQAIDLVIRGSATSTELKTIFSQHVEDGVCDKNGKLLMRWFQGRWVYPERVAVRI